MRYKRIDPEAAYEVKTLKISKDNETYETEDSLYIPLAEYNQRAKASVKVKTRFLDGKDNEATHKVN